MGSCWKTIGLEVCCISAPEQRQALLVTPRFWQHWRASWAFSHISYTFPILIVLSIPYSSLSPFYIALSIYL